MGVYTVNQTDGSLQRVAGGTLYADAPIASIIPFGGETAPVGWLICDGSAVSRTEYAELFAVIGINFGEGDGETTFGIPDLRECVPVGAGKNITKSIAAHDRYNLGQFKDDQVQDIGKMKAAATTGWTVTAGGVAGYINANSDLRTGETTHGKQLGVNYIIKAKMVGVPADLEAQIEADYQKKDLTSAVEGATTVEGALGALSTNKANKASTSSVLVVTVAPQKQRAITLPAGSKKVAFDIKATGVNTGSMFIGSVVGYNELYGNRYKATYTRDAKAILVSNFTQTGTDNDATITIGNPLSDRGTHVILTFSNYDASNVIVGEEENISITDMGDKWQKLVTESDITPTQVESFARGACNVRLYKNGGMFLINVTGDSTSTAFEGGVICTLQNKPTRAVTIPCYYVEVGVDSKYGYLFIDTNGNVQLRDREYNSVSTNVTYVRAEGWFI